MALKFMEFQLAKLKSPWILIFRKDKGGEFWFLEKMKEVSNWCQCRHKSSQTNVTMKDDMCMLRCTTLFGWIGVCKIFLLYFFFFLRKVFLAKTQNFALDMTIHVKENNRWDDGVTITLSIGERIIKCSPYIFYFLIITPFYLI